LGGGGIFEKIRFWRKSWEIFDFLPGNLKFFQVWEEDLPDYSPPHNYDTRREYSPKIYKCRKRDSFLEKGEIFLKTKLSKYTSTNSNDPPILQSFPLDL
jgi:hypothetical protein